MPQNVSYSSVPSPKSSPGTATRPLPVWLSGIVLLGALLMATGAALALFRPTMLVSPGDEISHAVTIYAGYLVSRNLVLALMLLLALGLRARGALHTLMLLTGFVQLLDAGLDCIEGRWAAERCTLLPKSAQTAGCAAGFRLA